MARGPLRPGRRSSSSTPQSHERLVTDDLADLLDAAGARSPSGSAARPSWRSVRRDPAPRRVVPAAAGGRRSAPAATWSPSSTRSSASWRSDDSAEPRGYAWAMSEFTSEDTGDAGEPNESYNTYSVDDEDQPRGTGTAWSTPAGSTSPWTRATHRRRSGRPARASEHSLRGGEGETPRAASRPGGARAGPLRAGRERDRGRHAARSAPSGPAGSSTRTRGSAPTWRRTWSPRTSGSTVPARGRGGRRPRRRGRVTSASGPRRTASAHGSFPVGR